ncbi:MAG: acyl-CoA/acyl-ACP dehydrogenase [bacterium]|nr:acyl-CoA/acyl-ACP dehydrogenase [bacterium]
MIPKMMNQLEKPLAEFITRELEPRWDDLNRRNDEILREILKASAPLGLSLAIVPEELSGSGFPPQSAAYILEELAASAPAFATIMGLHYSGLALILSLPDPGQKRQILAPLAGAGDNPRLLSPALWEDPAPRDLHDLPASLSTRLEHNLITGGKNHVVFGEYTQGLLGLARDREEELSWVLFSPRNPNLKVRNLPEPVGLRLCPFAHLEFDKIPAAASWPANPLDYLISVDGFEAAIAVGIAQGAFNRTLENALERYQGGKTICDQEPVRGILADRGIAIEAARALAYRSVSWGWDQHAPETEIGASAFATELAPKIVLDCIQILGRYGYMEDPRLERFYRDAKTYELIIARAGLRKSWYITGMIAGSRG